MKNWYHLILFLLLAVGIASCTGSRSYAKKAQKLQEAGLNDEAAAFYYQSLIRNHKNIDAQIGLKVTGQKQIESTLNGFYKAYSVSNYTDAVKIYQKALYLKDAYGRYVTMEVPTYYDAYYQEMLDLYLADVYEKATDLQYEEKFKQAHALFQEILKLNPLYRDVGELSLVTKIEPIYREGVAAFDAKKYRTCYYLMNNVLSNTSSYKDAIDYKERALEAGRITVAILPFEGAARGTAGLATSLQSKVVAGLTLRKDPFLQVLDRSNTDALILEQKINVHGASTGSSAIKTGELLGANVLVSGKIINYQQSGGRIRSFKRNGYESYVVKLVNPETKKTYRETRYKRVNYLEYEGSAAVYLEVQYQLVSAETGQVISSAIEKDKKSDYVNFITYSGNYKKLYAGKYGSEGVGLQKGDVIYNKSSAQRQIRSKVTTKHRTLESFPVLSGKSVHTVSTSIINSVSQYNPDEK